MAKFQNPRTIVPYHYFCFFGLDSTPVVFYDNYVMRLSLPMKTADFKAVREIKSSFEFSRGDIPVDVCLGLTVLMPALSTT